MVQLFTNDGQHIPDSRGWKDCTPLKEKKVQIPVGTRKNTIHLNFHYFSAGILVPFMKNVVRNVVL